MAEVEILSPPPAHVTQDAVDRALEEDLGRRGDVTTTATIPVDQTACCTINARQAGILSGIPLLNMTALLVDENLQVITHLSDGAALKPGTAVAQFSGPLRSILTAERTALNFMGHMSGIATLTAAFVAQTDGCKAQICDTRKTTPGLRAIEKYAVACGGGANHRFGLDDAILIKDNHIAGAGSIGGAIERARAFAGHMIKIEVEVDTLDQLEEALDHKFDAVLLDNMSPDQLKKAVALVDGRITTEASGGVDLNTVRAIAQSGVDLISVGALTHSAPSLDLGLDFDD